MAARDGGVILSHREHALADVFVGRSPESDRVPVIGVGAARAYNLSAGDTRRTEAKGSSEAADYVAVSTIQIKC